MKNSEQISRSAEAACTTTRTRHKYATLRQLRFEKQIPMLYLQAQIAKLELQALSFSKHSFARKGIIKQLTPLYAQLMDHWRRENNIKTKRL